VALSGFHNFSLLQFLACFLCYKMPNNNQNFREFYLVPAADFKSGRVVSDLRELSRYVAATIPTYAVSPPEPPKVGASESRLTYRHFQPTETPIPEPQPATDEPLQPVYAIADPVPETAQPPAATGENRQPQTVQQAELQSIPEETAAYQTPEVTESPSAVIPYLQTRKRKIYLADPPRPTKRLREAPEEPPRTEPKRTARRRGRGGSSFANWLFS
jgi:hypothetical protein